MIAGVPVYVGASWLLIAVVVAALFGPLLAQSRPDLGVLAYAVASLFAVILLVSVLVHEAAHAMVARAAGLPVIRVVADLWGGHTAYEAGRATPVSSALVSAAGPAANLVLAGVAYLAGGVVPDGVPALLVERTLLVNVLLALFNLLPGLPLDGGQLVDAAVWRFTGSRHKGQIAAGWCGRVVAVLVLVVFLVPVVRGDASLSIIWGILIAGFMWTGASAAISRGTVGERIDRADLADLIVPAALVPESRVLDPELVALLRRQPVVVHDARGVAVSFATAEDLAAVPSEALHTTPVGAIAVRQHPGWLVDADPAGPLDPVIDALVETRASLVAVVHSGRLHGVVLASSVNAALGS